MFFFALVDVSTEKSNCCDRRSLHETRKFRLTCWETLVGKPRGSCKDGEGLLAGAAMSCTEVHIPCWPGHRFQSAASAGELVCHRSRQKQPELELGSLARTQRPTERQKVLVGGEYGEQALAHEAVGNRQILQLASTEYIYVLRTM